MEEAEKLSFSTALPQLIHQIEVNTKFKASLLSSGILEGDILDSLIEKNNGQNLIFKVVQTLKKANQKGGFREFHQVLRSSGQTKAADSLQTELIKHTQRMSEVKETRASERPHHLPLEARNSLGALSSEIAPTARSTSTRVSASTQDLAEMKAKLQRLLPTRHKRREKGDVTVTRQYYQDVYDFLSKPSAEPPGPLPDMDPTKSCHLLRAFRYLPPEPCALLSRTFGGRVALTYHKDKGHPVLRSSTFEVVYCVGVVMLDPGGITKCTVWLSAHNSLRESLSYCTSWPEFEGRSHTSNYSLDLSMSGADWYSRSVSTVLRLSRKGPSLQGLLKEEKRRILHEHVKMIQHEDERMVFQGSYGKQMMSFATGSTDKEPGPLQVLNQNAAAFSDHNVCHLPIELSAALIGMYGGSVTLRKGREYDITTLDDMDSRTKFVSSIIRQHSGQNIGGFFLAVERTIADAVAAAIGTFPTRVQGEREGVDLDLDMTVRQWFDSSKTIVLLVWI